MKILKYFPKDNYSLISIYVGNMMEFYNFMLFAYLAEPLGDAFFPNKSSITTSLFIYGTFVSGYLSRPIGAIIFGYIGDTIGKAASLRYSILLTSVSTALIALTPNYNQIGIFAPALFIIFRIIQGLSVSGEEGGAIGYLADQYGDKKLCFIGGSILSSVYIGVILSNFTCSLSKKFIDIEYWRIPFFLGAALSMLCYFVRSNIPSKITNKEIIQFKEVALKNKYKLLRCTFIVAPQASCIYYFLICMPLLSSKLQDFSYKDINLNMIFILLAIFTVPIISFIADRYRLAKMFFLIGAINCLLMPMYFYALSLDELTITNYIILQTINLISVSLLSGTIFRFLITSFDKIILSFSVGLSFHLSTLIFGCSAPIVFTASMYKYNLNPFIFLSISATIGIYAILSKKNNTTHHSIGQS